MVPSEATNAFAGLRSRWTTRFEWRCARPSAISTRWRHTAFSVSDCAALACRSIFCARSPRLQYSITRHSTELFSSRNVSKYPTMRGWRTCGGNAGNVSARRARARAPLPALPPRPGVARTDASTRHSLSASAISRSPICAIGTRFIAYSQPSALRTTFMTDPNEPCPSRRTTSKPSMAAGAFDEARRKGRRRAPDDGGAPTLLACTHRSAGASSKSRRSETHAATHAVLIAR